MITGGFLAAGMGHDVRPALKSCAACVQCAERCAPPMDDADSTPHRAR